MSTITPQEQQWYKELVTPFQPMGRLLVGTDLRGTRCDRFGNGELRLVGYGDSSGGYAFSPSNQDAAIAPSFNSANLSNIANSLPQLTEVQDNAGKWIDSITLHALDEFIEQTEPQSFIPNTLRIFSGGQKGFRGEGTGNRNVRNTYTLVAEIPIPALTRADIPRSFTVRVGAYIPPSENIYLGLAIPQPYTVSFELWDLQANTQVGSGASSSIGGSSSVGNGNDLSDSLSDTPVDTQFVLPLTFASATWVVGAGATGNGFGGESGSPNVPPPTSGNAPNVESSFSRDDDPSQPSPQSESSPSGPTATPEEEVSPPSELGCVPIQDCSFHKVSVPSTVGQQINLGDYTSLCPKGKVCRGFVETETKGTFVLCCGAETFPPNNLGCTSLMKWSCVSGGNCVEDVLGTYNSLAECQAALIPPSFIGGQCLSIQYLVGTVFSLYDSGGGLVVTTTISGEFRQSLWGAITGVRAGRMFGTSGPFGVSFFGRDGVGAPFTLFYSTGFTSIGEYVVIESVDLERVDGNPDNCGNPPSTCP